MMKHERTLLLVVAAIFISMIATRALAQDKSGWAISATIGDTELRDVDAADTFRDGGLGWSVEFEHRFTENFALGLGGFDLGRAEDFVGGVDTRLEVRGYNFFGRVIFPISHDSEFYARIGYANYFVDIEPGLVSLEDALFGRGASDLGLGIDFRRREKLAFRLEGRLFDGNDGESAVMIALGINYIF